MVFMISFATGDSERADYKGRARKRNQYARLGLTEMR
jgi:hypothetical protein